MNVVWQLPLGDGCTARVERHEAVVWWRLLQPPGRAEVVGCAVDEQSARMICVMVWRDASGLDSVPDVVRDHALHGTT